MKHIINHFKTCYTLVTIFCAFQKHVKFTISNGHGGQRGYGVVLLRRDSRDSICPSTGHFVPPWDFYRGINFHEHMLTLLITTLQNCSLGECFLTIRNSRYVLIDLFNIKNGRLHLTYILKVYLSHCPMHGKVNRPHYYFAY